MNEMIATLEQLPVEEYPNKFGQQLTLQPFFLYLLHGADIKKGLPCFKYQFDLPTQVVSLPYFFNGQDSPVHIGDKDVIATSDLVLFGQANAMLFG